MEAVKGVCHETMDRVPADGSNVDGGMFHPILFMGRNA